MGIPIDDGEHSFYATANFYSEKYFAEKGKLAQKDGEDESTYLNSAAKGKLVFL